MGVQGERLLKTYDTAAATGTNFTIVYQSAANQITRVSGTEQIIVGVIENGPLKASESARVCFGGMAKVHAGTGAITRGQELRSDSRGYAVPAGTAGADEILGYAEEAAVTDGQIIAVRIAPHTRAQ